VLVPIFGGGFERVDFGLSIALFLVSPLVARINAIGDQRSTFRCALACLLQRNDRIGPKRDTRLLAGCPVTDSASTYGRPV